MVRTLVAAAGVPFFLALSLLQGKPSFGQSYTEEAEIEIPFELIDSIIADAQTEASTIEQNTPAADFAWPLARA